jgi:hypothetical protein
MELIERRLIDKVKVGHPEEKEVTLLKLFVRVDR